MAKGKGTMKSIRKTIKSKFGPSIAAADAIRAAEKAKANRDFDMKIIRAFVEGNEDAAWAMIRAKGQRH
jgi:hypothetical protein